MYLSSAVSTPRCQASGPNRAEVAIQPFGSDVGRDDVELRGGPRAGDGVAEIDPRVPVDRGSP